MKYLKRFEEHSFVEYEYSVDVYDKWGNMMTQEKFSSEENLMEYLEELNDGQYHIIDIESVKEYITDNHLWNQNIDKNFTDPIYSVKLSKIKK